MYSKFSTKLHSCSKIITIAEPRKIYSLDGQELYLDLCEEMKVSPVRSFLRGLLAEAIDLKVSTIIYNSANIQSIYRIEIFIAF